RTIDGHTRMAANGMHRGYVDNTSATLPQHQPRTGLREHQSGGEVQFDGLDNVGLTHRRLNNLCCNYRIVDKHVDAAQPLAHLLYEGAQSLMIASIYRTPVKALAGTQHIVDEGSLCPTQCRHSIPALDKSRYELGSQAATASAN